MKLVRIERSTNKNKKYVAFFSTDEKLKKVHFGSAGSSTYVDHKDDKKKAAYLSRHKVNENWNDPTSAGALSRYILWNKKTLAASTDDYKNDLNYKISYLIYILLFSYYKCPGGTTLRNALT